MSVQAGAWGASCYVCVVSKDSQPGARELRSQACLPGLPGLLVCFALLVPSAHAPPSHNHAHNHAPRCAVHCHEGRSRSVTLVLAYLMATERLPLREALSLVTAAKPDAAPNAGFMAQLTTLERELFGVATVRVKRTKPETRVCPVCGDKVGISKQSLQLHLRKHHGGDVGGHGVAATGATVTIKLAASAGGGKGGGRLIPTRK